MMNEDLDVDVLISLVGENPAIWDRYVDEYKDKNKARDAWRSICAQLKPNFEDLSDAERKEFGQHVIKRWYNIRDQWRKWKMRENRSGGRASKYRKYIYHDQLRFLEKLVVMKPTTSNMDAAEAQESDPSDQVHGSTDKNQTVQATTSSMKRRKVTKPAKRKRCMQSKKLQSKMLQSKMLRAIATPEPHDRHMMFFQGILPSLKQFTETQTLEFQLGVLQLVSNIHHGHHLLSIQPQQQPTYTSPCATVYDPQQSGPQYHVRGPLTVIQQVPPTWTSTAASQHLVVSHSDASSSASEEPQSPHDSNSSPANSVDIDF